MNLTGWIKTHHQFIVFILENHPINKKIRLTRRTREYNVKTPNTEKNHDHKE